MTLRLLLLAAFLVGCSSSPSAADAPDAALDAPADALDALVDAPIDAQGDGSKASACASTFGTALTAGFGRADGVVVAIVGPKDAHCAMPNDDHVVVQVRIDGAVYRMVVNVHSDRGVDPRVRFATVDRPLPPPSWSEGWRTGVSLDYPTTLDAHVSAFTPYPMHELVAKVTDAIALGAKVSVYAWTSGGSSAHKVHRNRETNGDGAIVVDAASSQPKWLLFHFDGQVF